MLKNIKSSITFSEHGNRLIGQTDEDLSAKVLNGVHLGAQRHLCLVFADSKN